MGRHHRGVSGCHCVWEWVLACGICVVLIVFFLLNVLLFATLHPIGLCMFCVPMVLHGNTWIFVSHLLRCTGLANRATALKRDFGQVWLYN